MTSRLIAGSLVATALARSVQASAKEVKPQAPPVTLSSDGALHELIEGNNRFVQGQTRRHNFRSERTARITFASPVAGILSCADATIAPELAFDSYHGDLFSVRVSGNFVNEETLASLEYAVSVLNTPLLVVLGHSACSALSSAIKAVDSNVALPGHMPALTGPLTPAVKEAWGKSGDLLSYATKANVRLNVERLRTAAPLLNQAVERKKLRIVGGYYNHITGSMDVIA